MCMFCHCLVVLGFSGVPCVSQLCFSFLILQEHYYDAESGSGYLAWRIKTVQRNTAIQSRRCSTSMTSTYGPKSTRDFLLIDEQLFGEECCEAISLLKHSTDQSVIKEKMRATFQHRQTLVQDQQASLAVLDVFPRFLDTPGLVRNTSIYLNYLCEQCLIRVYTFSCTGIKRFEDHLWMVLFLGEVVRI